MVVHIVEDDAAVADALAMVLEDLDHQPVIYCDGESFLAQAKPASEDWVIVDLGLPGRNGAEVLRALLQLPAPPRLLAISGKPRAKLLQYLRGLPCLRVLRKPISIDMLAAAMG